MDLFKVLRVREKVSQITYICHYASSNLSPYLTLPYLPVLDITYGSCAENNNIILYPKHGGNNQKWIVDNEGHIVSVHCPGKVIGSKKFSDPSSIQRLNIQSISQDPSKIQKWNVSISFISF